MGSSGSSFRRARASSRWSAARDWWEIERVSFLGDAVSLSLYDARDGSLYAALGLGHFGVKLRRSRDLGATWEELPAPAFPKQPDGQVETLPDGKPWPWRVEQVWALEAGAAPGELWCGTIGGGLFRSRDSGASWQLVRGLWEHPKRKEWFGGGADLPGIHSICVDPNDPRVVLVGVSCGGVWRSEDGGETWGLSAHGMFAEYMPPQRRDDEAIQDPHRIVQCRRAAPSASGRSTTTASSARTTAGARGSTIPNVHPAVFGFAVAVHPEDGDTAWLVPATKDEKRVPVDARVVVARTRDAGKTWTCSRAASRRRTRTTSSIATRSTSTRPGSDWRSAARRARSGRRRTAATRGPACPTTCRPSTRSASRNSLRGDAERPQHRLVHGGANPFLGRASVHQGRRDRHLRGTIVRAMRGRGWAATLAAALVVGELRDVEQEHASRAPAAEGTTAARAATAAPPSATTAEAARSFGDGGHPTPTMPVTIDDCPGPVSAATATALQAGGPVDPGDEVALPVRQDRVPGRHRGAGAAVDAAVGRRLGRVPASALATCSTTRAASGARTRMQLPVPDKAWTTAWAQSTGANDPLNVELTTMSGGTVSGPITEAWTFALGSLKGVVYYNTYTSPQVNNNGAVMVIKPGASKPTPFLVIAGQSPTGPCISCHSRLRERRDDRGAATPVPGRAQCRASPTICSRRRRRTRRAAGVDDDRRLGLQRRLPRRLAPAHRRRAGQTGDGLPRGPGTTRAWWGRRRARCTTRGRARRSRSPASRATR